MNAALAWITVRSLRGRIVRAAAMLRRPKYLVGFVVGVGWLAIWLGPTLFREDAFRVAAAPFPELSGEVRYVLMRVAAAAMALWFSVTWLVPFGKPSLGFREAELHFLLPAPISRRQLLAYGILRAQPGIWITTIVLGLMFGMGGVAGRLRIGAGLWLVLTTWDLASKARGLFLLRQSEVGRGRARRRWAVVVAVIVGFWAGVGPWLAALVRGVIGALLGAIERDDVEAFEWLGVLAAAVPSTAARWLLEPFVWLFAPVLAGDSRAFWVALGPAVVIMLVLREIVVRSPAHFEESALVRAQRAAQRKSPTRAYTRMSRRAREGGPFRLAATAPPAIAVLWKNLTKVTRRPLVGWALTGAVLCLAAAVVPALAGTVAVTVTAPTMVLVGSMLLGLPPLLTGMMWTNDLRSELGSLDLVRTWPIAPRRFVLAQVGAPALLSGMTCLLGACLIGAAVLSIRLRHVATGETDVLAVLGGSEPVLGVAGDVFVLLLVAGILVVAVATAFFSSAVQNLVVLWLPAWVPRDRRSSGMAAFGSQMLFVWSIAFAVFLATIPGGLLVGGLFAVQWWLGISAHALELPLAGVLVATPMTIGTALVVRAGSDLWERLDPSAEILES